MKKRQTKKSTPKAVIQSQRREIERLKDMLAVEDNTVTRLTKSLEEVHRRVPKPLVWTSADGARTAVTEMDEQHLRNTICYLQRTLVLKFGHVRYLSTLTSNIKALAAMLDEARQRGFEV